MSQFGDFTITACNSGKLDAVNGSTHPNRRRKAVKVVVGDVLEVVTEKDWPHEGVSTQMVRVTRAGKLAAKAVYHPSRLKLLTLR